MYKHKIRFLAEGFVEETLLTFLKVPPDMITNTGSMQKVPKAMESNFEEVHDRIVLALIDQDPHGGNQPIEFDVFKDNLEKVTHNLLYKEHPDRPHILIIVCPAMEKWLLEIAKMNDVKPETHNLSADFKKLKKITGSEKIGKDKDFESFLTELLEKSPELQTLKTWLQELKQNALPHYTKE